MRAAISGTIWNFTDAAGGGPAQYWSCATSRMDSPLLSAPSLYGPVPTGARPQASQSLAARNARLLMICAPQPANRRSISGSGCRVTSRTPYGSGRLDLFDRAEERSARRVATRCRRQDALVTEGESDILRGHLAAVMELHALAQREFQRAVVGAMPFRGQHRAVLQVMQIVGGDQIIPDVVLHTIGDVGDHQKRIEQSRGSAAPRRRCSGGLRPASAPTTRPRQGRRDRPERHDGACAVLS